MKNCERQKHIYLLNELIVDGPTELVEELHRMAGCRVVRHLLAWRVSRLRWRHCHVASSTLWSI